MSGRIFARYTWRINGAYRPGNDSVVKRWAQRRMFAAVRKGGHGTRGSLHSGAAGGPLILQVHNQYGTIVVEEL